MDSGLERLSRNISNDIEEELFRIGILCRLFARAKSKESIERKMSKKTYSDSKKIQDLIGIRVVVYFKDDLPLVHRALKSKFNFVDETVDKTNETVFEPNRINLIFRLKDDYIPEVQDTAIAEYNFIDTTYEVQLRTILSEGWHEVEHDLRYKCNDEWDDLKELSRTLNGIYASLETNDWSILSLFDQLSYEHYKKGNMTAMIRNKFRIRFVGEPINKELSEIIANSDVLMKQIFRTDRMEFLNQIFDDGIRFPLTMSNLIYVLNGYYLNNKEIKGITPKFILDKKEIFPLSKLDTV